MNKKLQRFVDSIGSCATPAAKPKTRLIRHRTTVYSDAVNTLNNVLRVQEPGADFQIETHGYTDGSTCYYVIQNIPDERKSFFFRICNLMGESMWSVSWMIIALAILTLLLVTFSHLFF